MQCELYLIAYFVTVQYVLFLAVSGKVSCVCQKNFCCAILVISGKLCLAVSLIIWQYELFLAVTVIAAQYELCLAVSFVTVQYELLFITVHYELWLATFFCVTV